MLTNPGSCSERDVLVTRSRLVSLSHVTAHASFSQRRPMSPLLLAFLVIAGYFGQSALRGFVRHIHFRDRTIRPLEARRL